MTLRLDCARGLKVGLDVNNLVEIKERTNQTYGQAIALISDDQRIIIPQSWNTHANLWIRQDNPLPVSVLAVIPEIDLANL